MRSNTLSLLILSVFALGATAHAAEPAPDVARSIDSALLDLAERDRLGATGESLVLERPAQTRYELGAVVDVRNAANGLVVLAVTPGGAAERLGVRPGDRIMELNGVALAGRNGAARTVEQALESGRGKLHVQLMRDGKTMKLTGQADVVAIPAYTLAIGSSAPATGCGYVSTELGVPPTTRGVFDAQLTKIDGRSTPLTYQPNRHRLAPGRHMVVVDERIPRSRLGLTEQRYIDLMRERKQRAAYKPLVIEVKPDTMYHVGSRLVEAKLDRNGILANAHWEPVVFSTQAVKCN